MINLYYKPLYFFLIFFSKVLEHHHAAVTFKILSKETSNIFATIQGEDYKQLRKLIIANILATDMKVHFDVMSSFNDLRERMEKCGEESFSNIYLINYFLTCTKPGMMMM